MNLQPGTPFQPHGGNPFGVMVPGHGSIDPIAIARHFGVAYFRPLAVFLDRPVAYPIVDAARAAGLKLVLTVRANGDYQVPTRPPGDLRRYQAVLRQVLERYQPAIVAIENEMNWNHYWTGTPEEYLAELTAASEVAHSLNIPVTDGGLVSGMIAGLTAYFLWETGRRDQAVQYARRTLSRPGREIRTAQDVERGIQRGAADLERGRRLLSGFQRAGADRVNFHWYIPDAEALATTVQFLHHVTHLPVMTNEIGQHTDDPNETRLIAQTARDLGVEPIIWYSIDTGQARALIEANGQLRPAGDIFRQIVLGQ